MFVTLGYDNPVVVAIHSESGVRTDALNKGAPLWPLLQRTWFHEDGQYSHYQATIHDTTAHAIFVYIASKLANTELGSDLVYVVCALLMATIHVVYCNIHFPEVVGWIAITIFINIVLSYTQNL